jgi:RHS repeat-associated protein
MTNSVTLGNSLLETTQFNARFQPTSTQAGSLLTLGYSYGTSNNNGNIQTASIYDGTTQTTYNQSFTYDGVNRLTGATEANGDWNQTYVYDAYGNRALLSGSSDASGGVQQLLDAVTTSTSSVPFNTNNHSTAAGVGYGDGRGNLTSATASPNFFTATYDAENRQIKTVSTVAGTTTTTNYTYDGNGQRVTKAVTGAATTTYVYDALGHLTAEYSTGTNSDSGTQYLTNDMLGSTRMTTNSAGGVTSRSDYLPFGQEIPTTWGNRTLDTPYTPDPSQTLKFTQKERDTETGLDFFEARYFSSAQGRFTSPDEFKGGIVDAFTGLDIETNTALPYSDITDPQTLNKYGYVRNNPLRYTDPDGHCIDACVIEIAAIAGAVAATGAAIGYVETHKQELGALVHNAVDAISSIFSGSSTGVQQPTGTPGSPATAGATTGTPGTPSSAPGVNTSPMQASGPHAGGTYTLVNPKTGDVEYVGRSNNLDRRAGEHARDAGKSDLEFKVDKRTDSYPAQRGREQQLYDQHRPAQNKVRPVSPKNRNAERYRKAAGNLH